MKLYLLSQEENRGFDTFDSILVCAENEEDAKTINPYGELFVEEESDDWAKKASDILCEEIGEANDKQKRGVIISSFNAD